MKKVIDFFKVAENPRYENIIYILMIVYAVMANMAAGVVLKHYLKWDLTPVPFINNLLFTLAVCLLAYLIIVVIFKQKLLSPIRVLIIFSIVIFALFSYIFDEIVINLAEHFYKKIPSDMKKQVSFNEAISHVYAFYPIMGGALFGIYKFIDRKSLDPNESKKKLNVESQKGK